LVWNRERLISGLESGRLLPSLSPLIVQLIELASDDNSSLKEIAALIEKDPSLTIRILKLANSIFFRRQLVKSVQQAVVRIGVRQTRLLALSLLMKDTFPMGKVGAADYRRFWRLCLYQGLIAQSLAQRLKTVDAEEAFTAGFTQEIGLLVMLRAFADLDGAAEIPWYPLQHLLEWEKEQYGMDHREIGEFMLSRWKFPSSFILCQKAVVFTGEMDGLLPLAKLCGMASQLSAFICEPEACFQEVFDALELCFQVSGPLIHEVVAAALQQVDEVAQAFEVDVDSKRDAEDLAKKAGAALERLYASLPEMSLPSLTVPPLVASVQKHGDSADAVRYTRRAVERDIRAPLGAVGGFVRMLATTVDPASDQGMYIEAILSETQRLEQALTAIATPIVPPQPLASSPK
jgi:HD-like signal output (HDOD) protein